MNTMGCSSGTIQRSLEKVWCPMFSKSSQVMTKSCDGILQCRDAAIYLRPVTNIKGTPREEQKRTYVVCDATSHNPITNPVVRFEAYGQTSLDRHVHVGHAECLEHEMRHVLRDSDEVHKCDREQDVKRT